MQPPISILIFSRCTMPCVLFLARWAFCCFTPLSSVFNPGTPLGSSHRCCFGRAACRLAFYTTTHVPAPGVVRFAVPRHRAWHTVSCCPVVGLFGALSGCLAVSSCGAPPALWRVSLLTLVVRWTVPDPYGWKWTCVTIVLCLRLLPLWDPPRMK